MKLRQSALTLGAILPLAFSSTANATTVLTTDFDSLATGAVTSTNLDGITTGGTWALNTSRDATYIIQDDGGDRALLADDTTGSTPGRVDFFTVSLGLPADINATSIATVDFTTATRRTGQSKALTYEFLDSGGNIISRIIWANSGAVTLNAGGSQGSSPFFFTGSWDADGTGVRDVSVSFDGTNTILDFNGVTGTVPLLTASTDLAAIRVSSDFNAANGKGLFFTDLTVSVVPEPSSALLGFCSLALLLRRRR